MNKRSLSLLTPFLLTVICQAQIVGPEVIGPAGAFYANTDNQMSVTIGEPVTATVSAGNGTLTQGFEQPWADIVTVVGPAMINEADITVFPNPTQRVLHVQCGKAPANYRFELRDAGGRVLQTYRMQGAQLELDMAAYASGTYYLRVHGPEDRAERTFKINVNH